MNSTTDNFEFQCIPTVYRGVELKSRLEAQAAFLFDALGWEWQYEPKSFMLPNGVAYTPDFLIPKLNLFVECRGYSSDKGDMQLRGFAGLTEVGIQTGIDQGESRDFMILMGDRESYLCSHGKCVGTILLLHCVDCGWGISGVSNIPDFGQQFAQAFCASCIAPMYLHERGKWDGRERIDRSVIVTVRKGKILLNGLPSEHWDSLLIGRSKDGDV